jgi:hypothetical protein
MLGNDDFYDKHGKNMTDVWGKPKFDKRNKDERDNSLKTVKKRLKGMLSATNKIYKKPMEEENLQELSKKTLKSYAKKAAKDYNSSDDKAEKIEKKLFSGSDRSGSTVSKKHPKLSKKFSSLTDKMARRDSGMESAYDRLINGGFSTKSGPKPYHFKEEENLQEVSRKKAIATYIERNSKAQDFYDSKPNDASKAAKTLKLISKKFGKKTKNDALHGVKIDQEGRGYPWYPSDYLDAKEGVYSGSFRTKFSGPKSKKGLKQRLDYMRMNKGHFKGPALPLPEENIEEAIGPKFGLHAGTKPKKKVVIKKKKSAATPPWVGKKFKGHGKFKE